MPDKKNSRAKLTTSEQKLVKEVKTLNKELTTLSKEVSTITKEIKDLHKLQKNLKKFEFVRILKKPFRLIWLSLLKGIMVGFGSVVGASVVVAIALYLLAKISFVPIVGDFVKNIMEEINLEPPQEELLEESVPETQKQQQVQDETGLDSNSSPEDEV